MGARCQERLDGWRGGDDNEDPGRSSLHGGLTPGHLDSKSLAAKILGLESTCPAGGTSRGHDCAPCAPAAQGVLVAKPSARWGSEGVRRRDWGGSSMGHAASGASGCCLKMRLMRRTATYGHEELRTPCPAGWGQAYLESHTWPVPTSASPRPRSGGRGETG